jgi:hypothetical protein
LKLSTNPFCAGSPGAIWCHSTPASPGQAITAFEGVRSRSTLGSDPATSRIALMGARTRWPVWLATRPLASVSSRRIRRSRLPRSCCATYGRSRHRTLAGKQSVRRMSGRPIKPSYALQPAASSRWGPPRHVEPCVRLSSFPGTFFAGHLLLGGR